MDTVLRDLRFAVRTLRSRPNLTVVAIAALALGIGANSAIFSVVQSVLLRELPYRNPEELVSPDDLFTIFAIAASVILVSFVACLVSRPASHARRSGRRPPVRMMAIRVVRLRASHRHALALCASLLFALSTIPSKAVGQSLVIRDIDVVDVRSGALLPDRTVVIEGDRITRIVESGSSDAPVPEDDTRVIDGAGKYLIPGLWNLHVHLEEPGPASLGVIVAYGVTSVRDMGTPMDTIRSYRESAAAGMVAPRIEAAGMMITNPAVWSLLEQSMPESIWEREKRRRLRVGTPEEARAAVQLALDDGADFVKLHWNASRETYAALAEACRESGLTFAGHDPLGGITLEEIATAGQRSIEHIDGSFARVLGKADDAERARLYRVLKENDTHFVPTMITFLGFDRVAGVTDLEERMAIALAAEGGRYVTPAMDEFWRMFFGMYPQLPPVSMFEPAIEELRGLHAAGIPLMPGTDLGAPLVYPGSTLHDELGEFVDRLGMTPAEALRSATLVPARFFGLQSELGTVEEGMLADLVLLDRNPLENIADTRAIHGVVLGGRYLGAEERSALLEGAAFHEP